TMPALGPQAKRRATPWANTPLVKASSEAMPGSNTPAFTCGATRSVRVTRAMMAVEKTHSAMGIDVASARFILGWWAGCGLAAGCVGCRSGAILVSPTIRDATTARHVRTAATTNGTATAAASESV